MPISCIQMDSSRGDRQGLARIETARGAELRPRPERPTRAQRQNKYTMLGSPYWMNSGWRMCGFGYTQRVVLIFLGITTNTQAIVISHRYVSEIFPEFFAFILIFMPDMPCLPSIVFPTYYSFAKYGWPWEPCLPRGRTQRQRGPRVGPQRA